MRFEIFGASIFLAIGWILEKRLTPPKCNEPPKKCHQTLINRSSITQKNTTNFHTVEKSCFKAEIMQRKVKKKKILNCQRITALRLFSIGSTGYCYPLFELQHLNTSDERYHQVNTEMYLTGGPSLTRKRWGGVRILFRVTFPKFRWHCLR